MSDHPDANIGKHPLAHTIATNDKDRKQDGLQHISGALWQFSLSLVDRLEVADQELTMASGLATPTPQQRIGDARRAKAALAQGSEGER